MNGNDIVTILIKDRYLTLYFDEYEDNLISCQEYEEDEQKQLKSKNIVLFQKKIESIFEALKECIDHICKLVPIKLSPDLENSDDTEAKEHEILSNLSTHIQKKLFKIYLLGQKYTIHVVHYFLLYYFQIDIHKSECIKILPLEQYPNLNSSFLCTNPLQLELKANESHIILLNKLKEIENILQGKGNLRSNSTQNNSFHLESLKQMKIIRHIISKKPKIALLGHPNAGKSTLINALCGGSRVTVASDECTGTITELLTNENIKASTIDVIYVAQHKLAEIINEYTKQQLHRSDQTEASIQEKVNTLKTIYNEKRDILPSYENNNNSNLDPDLLSLYTPKKTISGNSIQRNKINQDNLRNSNSTNSFDSGFIEQIQNTKELKRYLSLCTSNSITMLISKVVIHLPKTPSLKWMDNIILVDTPGLFSRSCASDTKSTKEYPLTDRRAFEGAGSADIWVFLTPHQELTILEHDLNKLIENSPSGRGFVCITKFDIDEPSVKYNDTLTKLLKRKRERILEWCRTPTPPALVPNTLNVAVEFRKEFNRYYQCKKNKKMKKMDGISKTTLLKSIYTTLITHTGRNGLYYKKLPMFNDQEFSNHDDFDEFDENYDDECDNNNIDDDDDEESDDDDCNEYKKISFEDYLISDKKNEMLTSNILYCAGLECSLAHSFLENLENMLKISKFQELNYSLQALTNEISHHIIRIEHDISHCQQILQTRKNSEYSEDSEDSSESTNESLKNLEDRKKKNITNAREILKKNRNKFLKDITRKISGSLRIPTDEAIKDIIGQAESSKKSKFSIFKRADNILTIPLSFALTADGNIRECFLSFIRNITATLENVPFDVLQQFTTRSKCLIGSFSPFQSYFTSNSEITIVDKSVTPLKLRANEFIKSKIKEISYDPVEELLDHILEVGDNVLKDHLLFQLIKKSHSYSSSSTTRANKLSISFTNSGYFDNSTFVVKERLNALTKDRDALQDTISCIFKLYYRGLTSEQYCAVLVGSQFTSSEREYFKKILCVISEILTDTKTYQQNNLTLESFREKHGISDFSPIVKSEKLLRFTNACTLELQAFIRTKYLSKKKLKFNEQNTYDKLKTYELQQSHNLAERCDVVLFLREDNHKYFFDIIGPSEKENKGDEHGCFIDSVPCYKKVKEDELKEYFDKPRLFCVGLYEKND